MGLRIGGTYLHIKRGGKYEVEGRMKLQIGTETLKKCLPGIEDRVVEAICESIEAMTFVSYSSKADENALYGRPESEFLDGRFKDVTPKPGWVLRKIDKGIFYHTGNKKWNSDIREAKLYSGNDFATREWADLFSRTERGKIDVIRIEQEPK